MGLSNYIRENMLNIIVVNIIIFICFFAGLTALISYGGDSINENWVEYRCNPLIMPFADYFGHSASSNFHKCLGIIFSSHSDSVVSPFHDMFGGVFKTIGNIIPVFNKIRQFATKIRVLFLSLATSIFERLEDVGETFHFMIVKLLVIMHKMQGMFTITLRTLDTVKLTFESMWNGPIGQVGRFLCFHPNTPILMNNGTWKYIKNINTRDILKNNNNVIGVIQTEIGNNVMYNYLNTIVSGSHLVKENNTFIRVEDSKKAVKINKKYYPKRLFCLVTEKNIIECRNATFSDFVEYGNTETNNIVKSLVLMKLNNNNTIRRNLDINKNYVFGFDGNTKIKMHNGDTYIKDIKIGDKTTQGDVLGVIKQRPEGDLYTDGENIFSGDNIIETDKGFTLVKDIGHKYCGEIDTLYHIITEQEKIKLSNGTTMTDYLETNDKKTNEMIDELIEFKLNNC